MAWTTRMKMRSQSSPGRTSSGSEGSLSASQTSKYTPTPSSRARSVPPGAHYVRCPVLGQCGAVAPARGCAGPDAPRRGVGRGGGGQPHRRPVALLPGARPPLHHVSAAPGAIAAHRALTPLHPKSKNLPVATVSGGSRNCTLSLSSWWSRCRSCCTTSGRWLRS